MQIGCQNIISILTQKNYKTMTKKDYELIAKVIRREAEKWKPDSGQARIIDDIFQSFCDELARVNPNFDQDKFLTACGVE